MIVELQYLIGFVVFILLQSLAINGIFELFRGKCLQDIDKGRVCSGNLFYMIAPEFFERNRNKKWSSPFYSCVKCMSSVYSAVTFFPVVIYIFGFHVEQVFVWMFDAFILVTVNAWIYKQV